MGCSASTNTAIVTTAESRVPIASKKPLPPIIAAPDIVVSSSRPDQVTRSRVEPLPALPLLTGKYANNVAFTISLDESVVQEFVKPARPKRLQRLELLQTSLTAEQIERKQRAAEAKRNRIKENIRLKSARSSRPRSVRRELLESLQQTTPSDLASEDTVGTTQRQKDDTTTSLARKADDASLAVQQSANFGSSNPSGALRSSLMAAELGATGALGAEAAKHGYGARRRRPSTPLESLAIANGSVKLAAAPVTARSDTAVMLDQVEVSETMFSTRRGLAEQLSARLNATTVSSAAKQPKAAHGVVDDFDAELDGGLLHKTDETKLSAKTHVDRLNSSESGFGSASHSAEAGGKKPLSDDDIQAFASRLVERTELATATKAATATESNNELKQSPSSKALQGLGDISADGLTGPSGALASAADDDYSF